MPTFKENLHLGTQDPLIDTDSIDDGAITTDKIADGAVTKDKLACDSVGSCQIEAGAVGPEHAPSIINLIDEEARQRQNAILAITGRVMADEKLMVKSVSINAGQPRLPDENGNVNLVIAQGGGGEYDETLAEQVAANTGNIDTLFDRIAAIEGEGASAVRCITYWQEEQPEAPQRAGVIWYNTADQTLYVSIVIGTNPASHQRIYGWIDAEVNAEAIYMDIVNNKLYRYDLDINDLVEMPQPQEEPPAIDIDNALSTTSENPVQNKVITSRVIPMEQTIAGHTTAIGQNTSAISGLTTRTAANETSIASLENAASDLQRDVQDNTNDIGENASAIATLQDAQIEQFKKLLQPDGLHIFAEKADGGTTNDVVIPYASDTTPGILSIEDKAKIDSITPGQDEQDEDTAESLQARLDSPLYPEHYLTQEQIEEGIKYCPEYHKWPLVWHSTPENYAFQNGTLITEEQLTQLQADIAAATDSTFSGEVFAPGKWIYPAWEVYAASHSTSVTQPWRNVPHANDVLWDESNQRFVLYYNNTVYTKWGNSHLWMGGDGKPAKDTLHVRMPKWLKLTWAAADVGYQWKPSTRPLTLIWDGEGFYDAFDGVTDFWQAVKQCIAATNKLRLAPGKLYYGMMASDYSTQNDSTDRIPLAPYADIDGQGGGLFLRKDNAMPTGTAEVFYVSNSSSSIEGVRIHDITIASLQDHYGYCVDSFSTQPRLSIAGSGIRFLRAQFNVRGLTVENVKTFNMHSDFEIESTEGKENRRIVLRNVTSRNVYKNVLGKVSNCIFDNYDVTSDGYAGGGGHLIYFQGSTYGVTFRNCRFVQLERYRQPMFDWNGGKSTAPYIDSSVEFHNCYIEGAKLFFCGSSSGSTYPAYRWMRFFNCILHVKYRTYAHNHTVNNDSQSDGKYANWQFDHCNIACPEVFMRFGHRAYFNAKQLIVRDCNLVRYKGGADVSDTYPAFFAGFNGKFVSERNYVELPMSEGAASYWTPKRYINDEATPYVVEARSGDIVNNIHRHSVPTGQETAAKVARAAMGIEGLRGPYGDIPSTATDGTLYYDLTYNRPLWAYNERTTDNNTGSGNYDVLWEQTLTWYDEKGRAAIDTTPSLSLPDRPLFPLAGPLTDLPSEATDGTVYFDTTNNRPLWATHLSDGVGHTFLAWVDATGTAVSS